MFVLVLSVLVSFPAQADVAQKDVEAMIARTVQDQANIQGQALKFMESIKKGNRSCQMQPEALPSNTEKTPSTLLVFVTLSMNGGAMSDEMLKAYARDLRKVGGRLVIRGLIDDSFLKTAKRLKELGIEVDIDPTVFETFKVECVPVIIHTKGRPGSYNGPYDRMIGSVSVLHALEEFERDGDLDATHLLKKIRGAA